MPRTARKNINSRYIHIITQGIDKEYIFQKEEYKKIYIGLFKRIIKDFKSTEILAYCIMNNHSHFLIYTENINELSIIMKKINTSYAMYYNKINNRVGYVFRNRYYSQQILDREHLYNTFVYIHRNPVKAKIVDKVENYIYSSYNAYANDKIEKTKIILLFNSEDFKNQFYFIHRNFSEENILEIKEDKEKSQILMKEIIEKFYKKHNVNKEKIKKDNQLLKLLIKEIKDNCNVFDKNIAEYINIGKNRIKNLTK